MAKRQERLDFELHLKALKSHLKDVKMVAYELKRREGLNAIEVAEEMGVTPRQVRYQWKLGKRVGLPDLDEDGIDYLVIELQEIYSTLVRNAKNALWRAASPRWVRYNDKYNRHDLER